MRAGPSELMEVTAGRAAVRQAGCEPSASSFSSAAPPLPDRADDDAPCVGPAACACGSAVLHVTRRWSLGCPAPSGGLCPLPSGGSGVSRSTTSESYDRKPSRPLEPHTSLADHLLFGCISGTIS